MELKLYDTLTREKRLFRPLDPARVGLYVCGPTVYDFAHIGNARPAIVFDVLYRLLRHLYGENRVVYVRNITDVDDKINARAAAEHPNLPLNEAIRLVTAKTERQYHEDVAALGCLPPTVEPRATDHIDEMRALIERLVASRNAYVAEEHVLFSVPSMKDYGQLSKRTLDEMIAGARVDVAPYKRTPMDFVLWKPSKPGEPAWPSPAGIATPGRPGWHIECSAMSWKHLGETFDIHGGGVDLVFPHHENEIAQSRCAFHTPVMANYWMHNGFLQVEGEKMAKSAGNFVTIRELLADWPGQVIRFAMLQTHYRQPIDFTNSRLKESSDALLKISALFSIRTKVMISDAPHDYQWINSLRDVSEATIGHLMDDLNTPAAIADILERASKKEHKFVEIEQLLRDCIFLGLVEIENFLVHSPAVVGTRNKRGESVLGKSKVQLAKSLTGRARAAVANKRFDELDNLISGLAEEGVKLEVMRGGALRIGPLESTAQDSESKIIDSLISARNAARRAKNFTESDRIRDELKAMGVELEDRKDGTTTWKVDR
jgi:cysteinyl-tRNA synthetase